MNWFYQDVTIVTDADTGFHFIMEKLYQLIHVGLVEQLDENGNSAIGISFPLYSTEKCKLGNKIRLIGSKTDLELFNAQAKIEILNDYIHATSIRSVPENVSRYGYFFRVRTKDKLKLSSLATRKSKRMNISYEEAIRMLASLPEPSNALPFQWLRSLSNGARFRLDIGFEELVIGQSNGGESGFTSYGLSRKNAFCALPLF